MLELEIGDIDSAAIAENLDLDPGLPTTALVLLGVQNGSHCVCGAPDRSLTLLMFYSWCQCHKAEGLDHPCCRI